MDLYGGFIWYFEGVFLIILGLTKVPFGKYLAYFSQKSWRISAETLLCFFSWGEVTVFFFIFIYFNCLSWSCVYGIGF